MKWKLVSVRNTKAGIKCEKWEQEGTGWVAFKTHYDKSCFEVFDECVRHVGSFDVLPD